MAKIACLDVGLKRIGIAFCLHANIITPYEAVVRKNRNQAAREVSEILEQWSIETLVVGLPLSGGSCEEMQRRIKHFVSLLEFGGEIKYIDEYGSSAEAKEQTKGVLRHKKDGRIDSLAATIILQRYFDKPI